MKYNMAAIVPEKQSTCVETGTLPSMSEKFIARYRTDEMPQRIRKYPAINVRYHFLHSILYGAFAMHSLSLRKLPDARLILPIVMVYRHSFFPQNVSRRAGSCCSPRELIYGGFVLKTRRKEHKGIRRGAGDQDIRVWLSGYQGGRGEVTRDDGRETR